MVPPVSNAGQDAILFILTCIALGLVIQFFITRRVSFLPFTAVLLVSGRRPPRRECSRALFSCHSADGCASRASLPCRRAACVQLQMAGMVIGLLQAFDEVNYAFSVSLSLWTVRTLCGAVQ